MYTYSVTDVGKVREANQDSVYSCSSGVGCLASLFIVADGMGGRNGGDEASKICVDTIVDTAMTSEGTVIEVLEEAIRKANNTIYDRGNSEPSLDGMGTTAVVSVLDGRTLYVANVGDSRLYINGPAGLRQVTEDHSLVQEMVRKGNIPKDEAKFHPQKNVITRALGVGKVVDIDFFEIELDPKDEVMMCSDGLSNMVEDTEIRDVLLRYSEEPQKAAESLLEKANEYGGKDNISVIVIKP